MSLFSYKQVFHLLKNASTEVKAPQPAPKFKAPTIDQVLARIAQVETGGQSNPFIRTKAIPSKGSTAYGPYQMGLMLTSMPSTDGMSKSLKKAVLKHRAQLLKQRKLFNRYGTNPARIAMGEGDPRKLKGYSVNFDYGGKGATKDDKSVFGQGQNAYLHDMLARSYLIKAYEKAAKEATNQQDFYNKIATFWYGSKDLTRNAQYATRLMNVSKDALRQQGEKLLKRRGQYSYLFNNDTEEDSLQKADTNNKSSNGLSKNINWKDYQKLYIDLNKGKNVNKLRPGTVIKLPGNRTAIVGKDKIGWDDWTNRKNWN